MNLKELKDLVKKGFIRFIIGDELYESTNLPELNKNFKHSIKVIVDRLQPNKNYKNRIAESVETALNLSDGVIYFRDVDKKKDFVFSSKFSCPVSGFTIEEIEPRLFSFNSPNGACPGCDGLGYLEKFDPNLIVGNNQLSLSGELYFHGIKAIHFILS